MIHSFAVAFAAFPVGAAASLGLADFLTLRCRNPSLIVLANLLVCTGIAMPHGHLSQVRIAKYRFDP